MKMRWMLAGLSLVMVAAVGAAPEPKKMTAEEFVASLKFQQGDVELPGGMAKLKVPASFRYLGPQDAERVLVQAWGNPKGTGTLGMLFPADVSPVSENSWGVVITFDEDGYVSDKDADTIKYDKLLAEMQAGVAEGNEARKKAGYPTLALVGWATPPRYDKSTHKLYWAKELAFNDQPEHTLNYNVRVLGRRGVLVLNAVSGMNQLAQIEKVMPDVIAFTEFNDGHRYADFNPNSDRVAAYGIAALIAGGVAAKAGLFAKLFALILAGKKFIIIGAVALLAFLAKFLKRKKPAA
jgi:uncharacterized membrane-anchored protein